MKRFHQLALALVAVLFSATTAVAQTQKGNLMVGGDLADFNLEFLSGGGTAFKMDVVPKLAWFIKDDLAIGGYAKLGLATAKDAGSEWHYGIGALGRYFVQDKNVRKLEFSKRARFFVEANAGFGGVSYPGTRSNTNGLDLGVGPGLAYFITPNVALEALLKYELTVGFGSSVASNRLNLGIGFQIYLPTSRAKQIWREETGK